MRDLRFSWDLRKARSNQRKHGVSFDEAEGVFYDEHGLLLDDPDSSLAEDRFLLLGLGSALRVLMVCHCLREGGEVIRIINDLPGDQGGATPVLGKVDTMRKEYDFSKARRNPYARRLKKQITIRLDEPTVEYFKRVANSAGIPYQTLINLYLRDCAEKGRKLSLEWRASA